MLGHKTVSLKFSVNWLVGIGLLALVLIFAFIKTDTSWHPTLVFIAAVVAGAAGLTTAINNLDQRLAAANQAQIAAALDFSHRWNAPQLFECKKAGRDIIKHFRENAELFSKRVEMDISERR